MRRDLLAGLIALAGLAAHAQSPSENPDWRELDAPPPPPLRTSGLIPLEMPGSTLRFGVDPASITIGQDGIVHYVVVASSRSGAVNGMYEGLRCDKGEVRTYARHNPDQGWVKADSPWRALNDGSLPSRHALVIARTGACMGSAPNSSPQQIARDLRAQPGDRFRPEVR